MSPHRDLEPIGRVTDSRWDRRDPWALASVTLVAALLRIVRVADPRTLVFDEIYYAKDACWYATRSMSLCGIDAEQTQVHPPLGKWLLSLGIEVFGYDSLGWRIAAALAGSLTVALVYILARRALASFLGAIVASGMLAIDFLHFVQSRVAMLDVFTTLFGVASVLCLVLDREQLLRGERRDRAAGGLATWRPWRLAAGAAAGAAVASKWSGILFVVTALALAVSWELAARERPRRWGRVVREEGASIALALVLMPAAVYVIAYAGRLEGDLAALPWSGGSWIRSFWDRQLFMFDFHRGLEATHPYQSPPWSWLLLKRPVSYYFDKTEAGGYLEVVALGSPFVWWASALALVAILVLWARRRDGWGPEGMILTGFAFNYLPWLVLARGRSAVFLFYLLPAVPFMCLALGYIPARLAEAPWASGAAVAFAAVCLALFVFYYPVLAKV
ncbi:MAG TPA: phospholipid carrier-dependent glycosyltransferase, partial [Actinomycetota bacterium]|nr:phospholipid carrier-dependent glycosyltransferase [Actinomycetota bacterium]